MIKNEKSQIMNLQLVEVDQKVFVIEEKNGNIRFNLTKMARFYNKKPLDWLKTIESKRYINKLCEVNKITSADLVCVVKGGEFNEQGTWANDYRVAVRFAQWLDEDLAISVDELIWRILSHRAMFVEPVNGVYPIIYNGEIWYNYGDVLQSFGKKRSNSASDRKKRYPEHFCLIYRQNFITPAYLEMLNNYYEWKQLSIDFDFNYKALN